MYLYQKDEQALPGDVQRRNIFLPLPLRCSLSHYPLPYVLFSLSLCLVPNYYEFWRAIRGSDAERRWTFVTESPRYS
jgi:hypothetical protein